MRRKKDSLSPCRIPHRLPPATYICALTRSRSVPHNRHSLLLHSRTSPRVTVLHVVLFASVALKVCGEKRHSGLSEKGVRIVQAFCFTLSGLHKGGVRSTEEGKGNTKFERERGRELRGARRKDGYEPDSE